MALGLGALGILLGARRVKPGESGFFSHEIYFWAVSGTAFSGSLTAFFVLDLALPSRVTLGAGCAVIFLAAASLCVFWARLVRRRPETAPAVRFPALAAAMENVLLILAGAFLFALAFPGFISPYGLGPVAFIALVPVFIVIGRSGWRAAAAYGALYGFIAHALFNFWLAMFNPVALTVVLSIRVLYFIALFLLLKLADALFPRAGFVVQTALWAGYEFLSAQGFIAYSYGIFGYSQYLFDPLLQAASLGGVWCVSLLVIFPGVFLGRALRRGIRPAAAFFKATWLAPVLYAAVFTAALSGGGLTRVDAAALPAVTVACVQPNIDPWVGGDPVYEKSIRLLIRLSEQAAARSPDLVVWPETALVPSLRYHETVRDDQERYNRVIRPFLEFMERQTAPYLVGNNDREKALREFEESVSYNAAVLMAGRAVKGVYRKTHLVPFTEHFPYQDILPGIYRWLTTQDTHFYTAGGEEDADKVFEAGGIKFSTLICFEDTFGEISRRFVGRGAELLINLTNDAWSQSEAAARQHLGIAVFRAVETRRSLVRCTTSGVTAVIDPNGRITDRLPPFREDFLVSRVPVNRGQTPPAVALGDWCGWLAVIFAIGALLAGVVWRLAKTLKKR